MIGENQLATERRFAEAILLVFVIFENVTLEEKSKHCSFFQIRSRKETKDRPRVGQYNLDIDVEIKKISSTLKDLGNDVQSRNEVLRSKSYEKRQSFRRSTVWVKLLIFQKAGAEFRPTFIDP